MFQRLLQSIKPSTGQALSKSLIRLGWAGFWLQIVLGSFPVLMMGYFLLFSGSRSASRAALRWIEYLTVANLLVLCFTTFWSYRYVRLGRRVRDPERCPTESQVSGVVWTGVLASALGMLFSMIVMLFESASLLFYFLKAPQAGVPVIQTSQTEVMSWVSTGDMIVLVALNLTLFAETIVLIFSLLLLFQTTLCAADLRPALTES